MFDNSLHMQILINQNNFFINVTCCDRYVSFILDNVCLDIKYACHKYVSINVFFRMLCHYSMTFIVINSILHFVVIGLHNMSSTMSSLLPPHQCPEFLNKHFQILVWRSCRIWKPQTLSSFYYV